MKKYKLLLGAQSILLLPLISAGCNPSKNDNNKDKPKPDKPKPSKPDKKNENFGKEYEFSKKEDLSKEVQNIFDNIKLGETFDFKMKSFNLQNKKYSELLPTQVERNLFAGTDVTINEKYKDLIDIQINSANLNKESNRTGKFKLNLTIKDLKNNKYISKTIEVEGFNHNNMGLDENGSIPDTANEKLKPDDSELGKYLKANQSNRYDTDNPKYLQLLKAQQDNKSWDQVRSDLKKNDKGVNEYNEKAKQAGLDSYESSAHKGFTLPKYKDDGSIDGLSISNAQIGQGPSWVDGLGRDRFKLAGLARMLPNENYRRAALQTFGVTFTNDTDKVARKSQNTSGTMWIMDYQKPKNGKYPTKWYFGTNLHVADAIRDESNNTTRAISILKLNPKVKVGTTLRLSNLDDNLSTVVFNSKEGDKSKLKDHGLKVVYRARDFMNTSPKDFLSEEQKTKYQNVEEFADFAVIEVDFEKLEFMSLWSNILGTGENKPDYKNMDASALAKDITNDYHSNAKDHIKFKSTSYLKDYDKIDFPLSSQNSDWLKTKDQLFAVGFPNSTGDWFFEQYTDDDQLKHRNERNFSLWVNSDYRFFGQMGFDENGNPKISKDLTDRGNFLSYSLGYRTFVNKPGLSDEFISSPYAGLKQVEKQNGEKEVVPNLYKSDDNKEYFQYGLSYMPRHYAPVGGASGSSLRTQNNELVGIYHLSNRSANTGLAAAFRSEGWDYKGAYGSYNLPQYDLIYGGGEKQKSSYRQAMKDLYGSQSDFKTALFENGFEDSNIPNEFKFTKNESEK